MIVFTFLFFVGCMLANLVFTILVYRRYKRLKVEVSAFQVENNKSAIIKAINDLPKEDAGFVMEYVKSYSKFNEIMEEN